ncbi:MAG: iron-sulfur cluster assembly protein [Sphingobium sp.]
MTSLTICADQIVWDALRKVMDPCSIATSVPINIVDMGIVRSVACADERVRVVLRFTNPFCFQAGLILEAVETSVGEATGSPVDVVVDPSDDWVPEDMAETAQAKLRALRGGRALPKTDWN